jgi:hypothetical protein
MFLKKTGSVRHNPARFQLCWDRRICLGLHSRSKPFQQDIRISSRFDELAQLGDENPAEKGGTSHDCPLPPFHDRVLFDLVRRPNIADRGPFGIVRCSSISLIAPSVASHREKCCGECDQPPELRIFPEHPHSVARATDLAILQRSSGP